MSGALPAPDPTAGATPPDDTGGATDTDDDVVCTIAKDGQGGYIVYAGDEPEGGGEGSDMSEDDTDAMGAAGAAPAPNGGAPSPQGQPAASIGEALKIAMGILQDDESGGSGGTDQSFAAGFTGNQSPTPAGGGGMAQKF